MNNRESNYKYENYFTNSGIMINRKNESYNIKPIQLDAAILNFLISNELLYLKQDKYYDSKQKKEVVIDRIKIIDFPNLFVEYRNYQRDMRSVKMVKGEKTYTRKKGMMIEDIEIKNSLMKIPFMSENQKRKLYTYDFEYMEANQNILNAIKNVELKNNDEKKIEIDIENVYIQNLIRNKIVNEIFDYRNPQYLKNGTILEDINVGDEKYLLLGYLDPFKMENYCVKYGDRYLFELPEFQKILDEQRNNKEFLIDFLNFFYYNRESLNEDDLWKLSYFGMGIEKYIENLDFVYSEDFEQIIEILENNQEIKNEFIKFINMKIKESFNRINLRLKYSFMIFKYNNGNLEKYKNYFKELNQEDTNILKLVLSKIQELIPKSNYFYNLKENEKDYKNFISYIKTDEVFIIHVEYINPYKKAKLKSFYYHKIIILEDLIDYSSIINKEDEPLLKSFKGVKYYRKTDLIEQNGGDTQELIKKGEWSNIKNTEYIFDSCIRVLFSNTDERQTVHNIIYKKDENQVIHYYYMRILTNLNYYYNKKNENTKRKSFEKFNKIIDNLKDSNISCDFYNLKLYHYSDKDFYSYKIYVKKIDFNSKYFNINNSENIFENKILKNSFIYDQFLLNIPNFYYFIEGDLYRYILKQPEIEINGNRFKNYLYYYSRQVIDVLKSRINTNQSNKNFIFENEKYIFCVQKLPKDKSYKYVGWLFERRFKDEVYKNRNNKKKLIAKGEDCVTNLIQVNNEQIETINFFIDETLNKLIEIGEGKTKKDFFIYSNRRNYFGFSCLHVQFYPLLITEEEQNIYTRTVQDDYIKNVNLNNNSLIFYSKNYNEKKNLFGFTELMFTEILFSLIKKNI